MKDALKRLLAHVGKRRRYQMMMLAGLILACAGAEVLSIGALIPFLAILATPETVLAVPFIGSIARAVGIDNAADLVLPLTLTFAMSAVMACSLRMALAWASIRFSFAVGADLGDLAYRRTLYQPYPVHAGRNSSDVISGILQKIGTATHVLLSLVLMLSAAVLFVSVMLALLAIDPLVAGVAAGILGVSYALIARFEQRQLDRNGVRIAANQNQMVKCLQEGIGGIRDVLLDGTQSVYSDIYRKTDGPLRLALAQNAFISQRPRFIMEALGIVLIAALAYGTSRQSGSLGAAIPVLGALALGAQRMLPALQQMFQSWATVTGSQASLLDVIELLDQPVHEDMLHPVPVPIAFRDAIRLDSVRFRYAGDCPWIVDGLSLVIRRGMRVGFIGSTGSGKSTLLDLIMTLLEPTQGSMLVDGMPIDGSRKQAWQRTIAHVPQTVYLADSTMAGNIAFGVRREEVDMNRVRQAARQAQIAGFIENRPEGYLTPVGERGIRLSGGQRQRIAIARALYKQATVLVFDEATSALDDPTEQAIVDAIESLSRDYTILIAAHRRSSLRCCDTIVQLERGQVVAQVSQEKPIAGSIRGLTSYPWRDRCPD